MAIHKATFPAFKSPQKLPSRLSQVAFAFYMSAIMSLLMCTVVTLINNGLSSHLPWQVLQAYLLATPISFCCVLMVKPVVNLLVRHTVKIHPNPCA